MSKLISRQEQIVRVLANGPLSIPQIKEAIDNRFTKDISYRALTSILFFTEINKLTKRTGNTYEVI